MNDEFWGEIIHRYTRAQAIEDGVLVDVSETAREGGFKFPVAMTAAAYHDCVMWTAEDGERQTHQDESGRLWDVIMMAGHAARRSSGGDPVPFQLYRVPRGGRAVNPRMTTLVLHIGPGDEWEPVLTIMMPDED